MVRVGEIFWVAKVRGAGKASDAATQLQGDMENVAQTSREAATAQNQFGETATESSDRMDTLTASSGRFRTSSSLLAGGIGILTSRLTTLAAGSTAVAGAFNLATKAVTAFRIATAGLGLGGVGGGLAGKAKKYGSRLGGLVLTGFKTGIVGLGKLAVTALTSSTAAMAGAVAGGLALGGLVVRGLQKAGVMDFFEGLGSDIRDTIGGGISDKLLELASPVAVPFATFGGFVNGFMSKVFKEGIGAGIQEGLKESEKALEAFPMFEDVGEAEPVAPKDQMTGKVTSAPNPPGVEPISQEEWEETNQKLNQLLQQSEDTETETNVGESYPDTDIAIPESEVPSGMSVEEFVEETDVEDQLGISEEEAIARIVFTEDGQPPGMAVGGMVEETGRAVVHSGEAVLPESLVQAAERSSAVLDERAERNQSVRVERVEPRGSGGADVTNNYDITIGDQSLDLSTLSGRDLRRLAERVGDMLGSRSGDIAGGVN